MFQRLYVWQETPQWTTLWEDVVEKADLQIAEKKSNAHYLGALIIEGVRPSSPREVKRFLVIDGQQQLTTLQLLFCAYRDLARKNEYAYGVRSLLLLFCCVVAGSTFNDHTPFTDFPHQV